MPIVKRNIQGKEFLSLEFGKGDIGIYPGKKDNPILMFKNIPPVKDKEKWTNDTGEDFEGAEEKDFLVGISFTDPLSVTNMIEALTQLQKKLLK